MLRSTHTLELMLVVQSAGMVTMYLRCKLKPKIIFVGSSHPERMALYKNLSYKRV
jgi:hypothetical protein